MTSDIPFDKARVDGFFRAHPQSVLEYLEADGEYTIIVSPTMQTMEHLAQKQPPPGVVYLSDHHDGIVVCGDANLVGKLHLGLKAGQSTLRGRVDSAMATRGKVRPRPKAGPTF